MKLNKNHLLRMKVALRKGIFVVFLCSMLANCSNHSKVKNYYDLQGSTGLPSYCELINQPSSLHESSTKLDVLAIDKQGGRYHGKIFFNGDIGVGYIGLSTNDSLFVNVKCSIYVGYTAVDLQGNIYQVFLQN